jgi:iron complex transport system substrate-binding protein
VIQLHANPENKGAKQVRWQKRIVFFLIHLCWVGILMHSQAAASSDTAPPTRVIRDKIGRQVIIPQRPQRIACIHGPSYEKLFAFGAADRVVIVANVLPPWDYALNPDLERIPVVGNFTAPDVEQLLQLKTDLVIYSPFVKQIERLTASGLPVVVPYDKNLRPTTLAGFFSDYYEQIRFYGELLGGKPKAIAEEYCAYMDEKIQRVIAVTSKIAPVDRPKVFYFCGQVNGPAGTQARFSTAYWLVEAAGGTMLTHDDQSYFVSVTTEQMILWNPDIIVVSTLPSIDPVINNPHWRKIKAVKSGKVFMSPEGIFYWSHFSTESFLCILFLAKLFHPQIFADLNIQQELKAYYSKFYHYTLTDDEADRIMNHLPPKKKQHP